MLKDFSTKILIVLILVIILFLGILYFNCQLSFLSIINNLVSELIGILITVFIVERIISDSEKKRRTNIERKAKLEVQTFVHTAIFDLLKINSLSEKGHVKATHLGGKRSDLAISYEIILHPDLFNINIDDPENVYVKNMLENMPDVKDFSQLNQCIKKGNYILNVFKNDLEPEIIDVFLNCLDTIISFKNAYVRLLYAIKRAKMRPKLEQPKMPSNRYVAKSLAGSLSEIIMKLLELHKLAKSS